MATDVPEPDVDPDVDVPPHLNGDRTIEERLAALESIAEGPPRLPDRLVRLEKIVKDNKLTASDADDTIVSDQATVNEKVQTRLLSLLGITGELQRFNLRLSGVLILAGSAVGSILLRIFGAF
jgi:hypothetical protein